MTANGKVVYKAADPHGLFRMFLPPQATKGERQKRIIQLLSLRASARFGEPRARFSTPSQEKGGEINETLSLVLAVGTVVYSHYAAHFFSPAIIATYGRSTVCHSSTFSDAELAADAAECCSQWASEPAAACRKAVLQSELTI